MNSGTQYRHLREMARVDGRPMMVSERYLGSVDDILALLDARKVAAAQTAQLLALAMNETFGLDVSAP